MPGITKLRDGLKSLPRFARIRFVVDRLSKLEAYAVSPKLADTIRILRRTAAQGGRPGSRERGRAWSRLQQTDNTVVFPGADFSPELVESTARAMVEAAKTADATAASSSAEHASSCLQFAAGVIARIERLDPEDVLAHDRADLEELLERSRLLMWDDETGVLGPGESPVPNHEDARQLMQQIRRPSVLAELVCCAILPFLLGPALLGGDSESAVALIVSAVLLFWAQSQFKNPVGVGLTVLARLRGQPTASPVVMAEIRAQGSTAERRLSRNPQCWILIATGIVAVAWPRWWVHGALFLMAGILPPLLLIAMRNVHPTTLLLGRSGEQSCHLHGLLIKAYPHRRTVSLLDDEKLGNEDLARLLNVDSLRRKKGEAWEGLVWLLLEHVDLIVVDARLGAEGSDELLKECKRIVEHGLLQKTLWIVDPDESSALVDRVRSGDRDGNLWSVTLAELWETLPASRRFLLRDRRPGVFTRLFATWLGVHPHSLLVPPFDLGALRNGLMALRRESAKPARVSFDSRDVLADELDETTAMAAAEALRRGNDPGALGWALARLGRTVDGTTVPAAATENQDGAPAESHGVIRRRVLANFAVEWSRHRQPRIEELVAVHQDLAQNAFSEGKVTQAYVLAGDAVRWARRASDGSTSGAEVRALELLAHLLVANRHPASPLPGTLAFIGASQLGMPLRDMGVRRKGSEEMLGPDDPDFETLQSPATAKEFRTHLDQQIETWNAELAAEGGTAYA